MCVDESQLDCILPVPNEVSVLFYYFMQHDHQYDAILTDRSRYLATIGLERFVQRCRFVSTFDFVGPNDFPVKVETFQIDRVQHARCGKLFTQVWRPNYIALPDPNKIVSTQCLRGYFGFVGAVLQ